MESMCLFMQHLKRYFFSLVSSIFYCLVFISSAQALTFALPPPGSNLVGQVRWTQALPEDTFSKIGRRYDIGYFELIEANPNINPVKIPTGTIIVIPSRFVLPPGPRRGLVVNLAELRVYYYPAHRPVVITYPVGIGRDGWETPLGPSLIAQKMSNPTWIVPKSIRNDRKKDGVYLPMRVPPGPDNPLGGYAMRLKQLTYLIHGTNDSEGVGRRSSAGCIRLFPEDIENLYPLVKINERVRIIDLPYKLGWDKNRLYLEAHVPLQNRSTLFIAQQKLAIKKLIRTYSSRAATVRWSAIDKVVLGQNGIPQLIGYSSA